MAQRGISALARQEERTAYILLIPTFVILLLIAIYPLARVFQLSTTDERFASSQETNFVGLENYRNLLSVTLREVPAELDAEGNVVVEDGQKQFVSDRLFLRRLDTDLTYDTAYLFNLFGRRYVLGAANADFIKSIWDTVVFTFFAIVFETVLGLIIALTLSRKFFGRGAMRTAMLVPWAIITVVSSLIWQWMFKSDRTGFFNAFFRPVRA